MRPTPRENGIRPIHQGKGGPVFGRGLAPPAAGGGELTPGVAAAPGEAADEDEGATDGDAGATVPAAVGLEELGAEDPAEDDTLGDGELMATPGPVGLLPEWTMSTTTPRNSRTTIIAATGRKAWAPGPPRRAMACLALVGYFAGV